MDTQKLGLVAPRLQYFQAIVQCGSIRAAAEVLRIAPSAISRSLRQLEDDLGQPLFERVRQRLKLTSAGETLAHHARASQKELARACAFIEDLQGLRRGRISIVAIESATRGLLPQVLSSFWQKNPNVTVDIRTAGSQEAVEALVDGDCDLALAFDVRLPRKSRQVASAHLNLGALLPPEHPQAASTEGLRLRDFAGQRVLMADSDLTLGKLVEDAVSQTGVEFQVRAVTTSIHTLVSLASSGHGVTFQTRVGVEQELSNGQLVFVPLLDRELKARKLSLMAPAEGQLTGAPASLAAMLGAAVAALDEAPPAALVRARSRAT
jgi:DNA-binding transcriptional LysR family regulator